MRALVVEDDPAWQEILQELLEDCGYEVSVASSLVAASEAIKANSHRMAVVDLSLGGSDHRNQDGLEALELLKLTDPGCAAVLLTGFATVELAVQVLTEGKATSCLRKESFERQELCRLAQESATQAPALRHPTRPPAAGPAALVVEDDAGWRALLDELLAECGFSPRVCSSFGEALVELEHQPFRLAVIDLTLSGKPNNSDGLRLLQKTSDMPTLVVSGTSDTATLEKMVADCPPVAFFEKQSFDRDSFCTTLLSLKEPSKLERLTERESEVVGLLAEGLTNQQIAEQLFISTNTVKRHLKMVFEKLEVSNRAGAAALVTESRRQR